MSLTLSKKHGVNPSVPVCFWCGKEKQEILLLGRLKDDAEAPRRAVYNYEPCNECKAKMDNGITFMESTDGKTPTGRFYTVTEESARRVLSNGFKNVNVDAIIRLKKVFLDTTVFDMLFQGKDIQIK